MQILTSYAFLIVAIGTVILAILTSLVGSINIYKGQSLIGDALGHASFFGVVLFFTLFNSKSPVLLLLGAMFSCFIAYLILEYSSKHSKIKLDANMAIVLSGFFGLGMALKSYIQGNSNFTNVSQAGLEVYIFGQAAYLLKEDVILIAIALIVTLLLLFLFYKEIKTYLFDIEFAKMAGFNTNLIEFIILFMTILTIGVGIKSVGAILIAAFMVIPVMAAQMITHKFNYVLIISSLIGVISAFLGTYWSTLIVGISTGPAIIIVSGIIFFIIMILRKLIISGRKDD